MSSSRRRRKQARRPKPLDPSRIDWRAIRWELIDRRVARFDSWSLVRLLSCAADSPGGVHRLPSLTILWMRCLAAPPAGDAVALPAHLPELLGAAGRAARQLRILEDFSPADPRLLVRYAVGGNRFRIHPGSLGDPLQALRAVSATADAIDPFVAEHHGFRLSDLIEVALRYSDRRLQALSHAWPEDAMPTASRNCGREDPRDRARRIAQTPVTVTDAEVAAVTALGNTDDDWISACADPDQAAAAWRWATRPADALKVDLYPGAERLGSVVAVSTNDGDCPVPASLLISALGVAASELAAEAAADQDSAARMHLVTERRALGVFGINPPDLPSEVAAVIPGRRHVFAVGVGSGLDVNSLDRSLTDAASRVREVTSEVIRERGVDFDPAGLVRRLIVYGGPVRGPAGRYDDLVCIHVDELVAAAIDADHAATGEDVGRDLLWQFIEELATLPGVAELRAWDFADVWQVWLSRGALNPGGLQNQHVVAVAFPDNATWERAAAWEPVDTVLTAARLPSSWEWAFAHLDEPSGATVGFLRNMFQILADPPLVLHVPLRHELAELGVDPAFAVGMADGVRLTFANNPKVAAVLTPAQGVPPLVCNLRLDPVRLPDTPADHIGVRMAATDDPAPRIDLTFGADWLELLAEDPASGHGALGRAMAEGMRHALNLSDQACEEFLIAWRQALPVAAFRRAETTLPPGFQGRYRLPRSIASKARARRSIAKAVVCADAPRALYTGEGAFGLLGEVIVPAATSALSEATADWSMSALITVAECLNDAHAERARRAGELALGLAAPWGERWQQMALDQPDPALMTRPLELVLELLLARQAAGEVNADIFDIAEAADIADQAIQVSLDLAAARSRLHDLQVLLDDDGQYAVSGTPPEPGGTAIDMGSYLAADRADRTRLRPEPLRGEPTQLTADRPWQRQEFMPLKDLGVPRRLLAADGVLKDTYGTGFDGISAVLGIAATWTPRDDKVIEVDRTELRDVVTGWSGLSQPEIDAALDRLTLTREQLRSEGLPYWEQEKRSYRLAIRPLVSLGGDRLLLIPRRLEATQAVFVAYLLDGRVPWPAADQPQEVRDAFNEFRKSQNRQLERAVGAVFGQLHLPVKTNIEPHQAEAAGLHLHGEIDTLAADPDRSRLWVCEVKDPTAAFSPSTTASRVARFLKPGGHVSQLLRNVRDVKASPAGWARFVDAPDPGRNWRVLPLMITRRAEPAAFTSNPAVPFVVLEDLSTLIEANSEPANGPVWPKSGLSEQG